MPKRINFHSVEKEKKIKFAYNCCDVNIQKQIFNDCGCNLQNTERDLFVV